MKPSRLKLYGLAAFMTLVWSLNYIAARFALRSFPPLVIGPLRAVVAAVLLAPIFLWIRGRRRLPDDPWTVREVGVLSVLGVFGITLNQVFFVVGMNRTSVAHAALMITTAPLLVILLAALRGQEHLTARKLAGMAVAASGIAVLNLAPGRFSHGATTLGDFFVFLSSLTFAIYTVFGKEVAQRHSGLTVNTIGYAAGALAGAPLLAWESLDFKYSAVSRSGWSALAYMALLSSIAAYLIFSYILRHMPASRVAAFSYIQPVIAAVAGLLILGEPVTSGVAAGGLLVLTGVGLTARG